MIASTKTRVPKVRVRGGFALALALFAAAAGLASPAAAVVLVSNMGQATLPGGSGHTAAQGFRTGGGAGYTLTSVQLRFTTYQGATGSTGSTKIIKGTPSSPTTVASLTRSGGLGTVQTYNPKFPQFFSFCAVQRVDLQGQRSLGRQEDVPM